MADIFPIKALNRNELCIILFKIYKFIHLMFLSKRIWVSLLNCEVMTICRFTSETLNHFVYYWQTLVIENVDCVVALQPVTLTLAILGKIGSAGAFGVVYVFSAELFPTVVRNAGMGACSCVARVGGMLAPYVASSVRKISLYRSESLVTSLFLWPKDCER